MRLARRLFFKASATVVGGNQITFNGVPITFNGVAITFSGA